MGYLYSQASQLIVLAVTAVIIAYYIWILAYSGEDRSTGKKQQAVRIAAACGASVSAVFLSLIISYHKVYKNDGLEGVFNAFFEIEFYKSILFSLLFATAELILFRVSVRLKRKLPLSGAFAISGRQRIFVTLVVMCGLTVAFFVCTGAKNNYYTIGFNEVCSNNKTIVADKDMGLICDYIELCNWGKKTVDISGLYLSDDENNLSELKLDSVTLAPGQLKLVLLDDSAGMSINKRGETLYLSDEKENIISVLEVPKSPKDAAYAYDGSTAEWGFYTCTPGVANDEAEPVDGSVITAPVLSAASGFYDEEFKLSIEAGEGAKIYYTLDCRRADENGEVYTEPILIKNVCDEPNTWHSISGVLPWYENDWSENVDKCVVVRAVAVSSNGEMSDETIATYFVGMDKYKDIPLISLVPDYDDFFSEEDGIYTVGNDPSSPNFYIRGEESEREAYFEYFGKNDTHFAQDVGIRIFGGTSRNQLQKRFTLFARKMYSDTDLIDFVFFGDGRKYKKLALRDGFANMISQEIMRGSRVLTVDSTPVTVFLDGEWFGDTYLQTKINAEYIAKEYNVDKDNIILIKNGEVAEGYEDELSTIWDVFNYVQNTDFSDEEAYKELCDRIDIESYIEFICANLYLANMDYYETHNFAVWRTRQQDGSQYGDCKWRFIMYDLDSLDHNIIMLDIWGADSLSDVNSFTAHLFTDEHYCFEYSMIYSALKKNKEFMEHFLCVYSDMLNFELSKERIEELLIENGETLEWNYGFFQDRNEKVLGHIAQEFGFSGDTVKINITIDEPEGGCVQINTRTTDSKTNEWSGEYLVEVPLNITAVANEGYEFAGWTGDTELCKDALTSGTVNDKSEALVVEPDKEVIELHAKFRKVE